VELRPQIPWQYLEEKWVRTFAGPSNFYESFIFQQRKFKTLELVSDVLVFFARHPDGALHEDESISVLREVISFS
jgi:hypothetical protein